MRRSVVVLLVLCVALVACKMIVTSSKGTDQVCPAWARYEGGVKCDIQIWKECATYGVDVELDDYEQVRFTLVGGEVIIDDGVNIAISRDDGEPVDYETQRLPAGTYIARREDVSSPASFHINNPHGDTRVALTAEFVRSL